MTTPTEQDLLDIHGHGRVHFREHFFEFDQCEVSRALREKLIEIAKYFFNLKEKIETEGHCADPYIAEEFNNKVTGQSWASHFRQTVPQTIHLDMQRYGEDHAALKLMDAVPFPKMRKELLEQIKETFQKPGHSITEIVIESHFRFLPISMKEPSQIYKNIQLGLSTN